jgi:hypothetical protein
MAKCRAQRRPPQQGVVDDDRASLPLCHGDQLVGEMTPGAEQSLLVRVVGCVLQDRLQAQEVEDAAAAGKGAAAQRPRALVTAELAHPGGEEPLGGG